MIKAVYKCPECENEYDTLDEAGRCATEPKWPAETKFATAGRFGNQEVFTVTVDGDKCRQLLRIHLHPAWGKRMGAAMQDSKRGFCRYCPVDATRAADLADECDREAKRHQEAARKTLKKAAVLREEANRLTAIDQPKGQTDG